MTTNVEPAATPHEAGRRWLLVDTIGPVASAFGFKVWDLCLARDAIVARRKSQWATVKAGVWAGLGLVPLAEQAWAASAGPGGERQLLDTGDPAWRRYEVRDLASITVVCNSAGNEIRIARRGTKPDVYGINARHQTDGFRDALRRLYPTLYAETGF